MKKSRSIVAIVLAIFVTGSGTVHGAEPIKKIPARTATKALLVGEKTINLKSVYVDRLQKIKKDGVTVVYPTYVPERFSIEDISVTIDEEKMPNYQLSYIDRKKKLEFTIETAYSGIGDGPDGEKTLKGNSKVFGPFTIDVFKPWSEGNDTKDTYYISSWMEDSKRKSAVEKDPQSPRPGRFYHFLGVGVSDKEALAIVESLTPIK